MVQEARRGEEGSSLATAHRGVLDHLAEMAGRHKELAIALGQLAREGTREADRLLEQHKAAEAEAKKLKSGMETAVSGGFLSMVPGGKTRESQGEV